MRTRPFCVRKDPGFGGVDSRQTMLTRAEVSKQRETRGKKLGSSDVRAEIPGVEIGRSGPRD